MHEPSKPMSICSQKGPYHVSFYGDLEKLISGLEFSDPVFLIDQRVLQIHESALKELLQQGSVIAIEAKETNKSLEIMPETIEALLGAGVRRENTLVVIGGGIVQDVGCFVASTLFRGLQWVFIPTTLLAQADSCIGSKSSINVLGHKNIIGTFNPPNEIHICTVFLETLPEIEIRSGVGEMLKVHMLDNIGSLLKIVSQYENLFLKRDVLMSFLHASLKIKKRFIEIDEFDKGIRNLLNYGHSFGHAIEGATNFRVPHGIAVTMGMDIANFVAAEIGFGTNEPYSVSHSTMRKNYCGFHNEPIPIDLFRVALEKDKKNSGDLLTLILPNQDNILEKTTVENSDAFWNLCKHFFDKVRRT